MQFEEDYGIENRMAVTWKFSYSCSWFL